MSEAAVAEEKLEKAVWARDDIYETDKAQLVLAQRGQGAFRRALERVEPCCRITRLGEREHLRASHIKPWRDSNDQERLDGSNGLLLAPHIDHLFDRGYLTFTDDGEVLLSVVLSHEAAQTFGVSSSQSTGCFTATHKTYLAYHREKVFIGG